MPEFKDLGDPSTLPPNMQKQLQEKLADRGINTIPGYNVGGGSGRGSGTATIQPLQPMVGATPATTGPTSDYPRVVPTPPRPGLMQAPGVMTPPPPPGAVAANRSGPPQVAPQPSLQEQIDKQQTVIEGVGELAHSFFRPPRSAGWYGRQEDKLSQEGLNTLYTRGNTPDQGIQTNRISMGTGGPGLGMIPVNRTGAHGPDLLHRTDPLFQQNNAGVGGAANFWNDFDPQHDALTSGIKNPSVHLR